MTNRTRTVHELAPWLHDALVQRADPLHHVCRHIVHELETGARDPADAAKLLNAALDAFPDTGAATPPPADFAEPAGPMRTLEPAFAFPDADTAIPPPSDLAELAGRMRSLERALARTTLPGDVVMMSATAHAHRCLEIGIERARAGSAENLQ